MNSETWVILGASSSIGRAFAREAAAQGADIVLAGRDLEDIERSAADLRIRFGGGVRVLAFDAAETGGHAVFAEACRPSQGRLNLFLCFGSMPPQGAMERDFTLARSAIQTNYLGAVSVLHAFAPLLEDRKGGRVVVLGSVAGDRGRPRNYVYGSAKAGLHAFLQGFRARMWRSGVTVTTIKPGFVDTAMTWGLPGLFLVASPQACARACLSHARKGAGIRYVPWFWWGIMSIIRAIPERVFKRLDL
ncbi:MAG: SDR family NAD(P)-dependent oxidoreductase [Rhodospirillales bacterium]|nr:SDR family NAD(P)-dependent oxidoreductase [Rhodospirillales bacterium]